MANFKFVVSEPKSKKAKQIEIDQSKAIGLIGKKIGDEFDGDVIGLSGYKLQITGGSDKDGFPMHPDVNGPAKKRVLLSGPPGFYPLLKGQRKRRTVRGNAISQDTMQINVKVTKEGAAPFIEEAKPAEEKKEEPAAAPA